jgi:hypothetical protein
VEITSLREEKARIKRIIDAETQAAEVETAADPAPDIEAAIAK